MNRSRLIRITAAFFAVMLCFTILSRAADQAGIAAVHVQKPESRMILHTVAAAGKVVQNREVAIVTEPDERVDRGRKRTEGRKGGSAVHDRYGAAAGENSEPETGNRKAEAAAWRCRKSAGCPCGAEGKRSGICGRAVQPVDEKSAGTGKPGQAGPGCCEAGAYRLP